MTSSSALYCYLGFTGTQDGMTDFQERNFVSFLHDIGPVQFDFGDCIGADEDAFWLVKEHLPSCRTVAHPPRIITKRAFCPADVVLEPKEYLVRNHDIVDVCNLLCAAPSGPEKLRSGTWASVRYARKKPRPIFMLLPH